MKVTENIILSSYWVIFIIMPFAVIGYFVVQLQYPKWLFVPAFLVLIVAGEHGFRKWAAIFREKDKK